jgi:arginine-tRNA-protein transferase
MDESSNSFPSVSRVQIAGSSAHECGYCKGVKDGSSVSYGMTSNVMSVDDYQSMMLIGWRRSGSYFYKPTMHETCCPAYTIRLHVDQYNMTRSHKKVIKTVEKYLSTPANDITIDAVALVPSSDSKHDIFSPSSATSQSILSSVTSSKNNCSRVLTMELEKSSYSDEKFQLYKRYQVAVHMDEPSSLSPRGFKRFLVDSPLVDTRTIDSVDVSVSTTDSSQRQLNYGTHHQLYRLNGKLIAMGVLDILPTGVSSVYAIYDNDYRHLVLGKYTAIKEIEFCKQHRLPYYYMGFYIHSCEKMRYKSEYMPSDLLCPTTLQWFPYNQCVPLLDAFNFTPLDPSLALIRAAKGTVGNSDGKEEDDSRNNRHHFAKHDDHHESKLDLSEFKPQFFFADLSDSAETIATIVPLDLGYKQRFSIDQLRESGAKQLKPIIHEWLEHVGPEIGRTVALFFH